MFISSQNEKFGGRRTTSSTLALRMGVSVSVAHFVSILSGCIIAARALYHLSQDFPVAQTVKNLPVMQETWVLSLGWEIPLEKGMAIHSSILAWRIPWTEEPDGLQSMGSQIVGHN